MQWAILLMAALLPACTVGPDFTEPDAPAPKSFTAPQAAGAAPAPGPEAAWWSRFEDPLLVDLIERALADNADLAEARARVRAARALQRAAGADDLPQLDGRASAQRFQISENGAGASAALIEQGLAEREGDLYSAGFDASWELDLFGGTRRAEERARAATEAAVARKRDALVSVAAEVARVYLQLRGAQRRLQVAEDNIRIQRETLQLVESRYDNGLVPELDLLQARQQLARTRATVPPQRAAIRVKAHALARLVGRPPGALLETLRSRAPLPPAPASVPAGLPTELIGRRPDLRAARAELHAATAEVGVAVARLYPRVVLLGSAGVEAGSFADVFDAASGLWSLGPAVSWPIFQGGRLRARADAERAELDAAAAAYRGAVLRALAEVESALVRYGEARAEAERLQEAVDAARETLRQARVRYDQGLSGFLAVLDAERALSRLEDRLASRETAVATRLVALYKALGGGWRAAEEAAAGDPAGQDAPGDQSS
jgi:NodT family efflux transporter outer membrane factor (OMF) lipoprotein